MKSAGGYFQNFSGQGVYPLSPYSRPLDIDQGWLKGVFLKPPRIENFRKTPLEKFWNTPPPSEIRREAPAPNWI